MRDLPYTLSFVVRKRLQYDNLMELPKEKRPPDKIIFDGTPEDIDEWLDRIFGNKSNNLEFTINEDEIE